MPLVSLHTGTHLNAVYVSIIEHCHCMSTLFSPLNILRYTIEESVKLLCERSKNRNTAVASVRGRDGPQTLGNQRKTGVFGAPLARLLFVVRGLCNFTGVWVWGD